jgi:hypothetical protein
MSDRRTGSIGAKPICKRQQHQSQQHVPTIQQGQLQPRSLIIRAWFG